MFDVPNKIPILLVTGFLGSGKTTLLRRLAETHRDWRMLFLVNEFADTNTDALTLETTGTPTQSVLGGSLFCECKAGEFVRVMHEQVLNGHAEQPLDALVIETSGIADPEAIGELMSRHGLSAHFEIRRIVCVVAAKRFLSLLGNLPAVAAQIRTSDLVIINKTDLVDEAQLQAVETAIAEKNPTAERKRASYCDVSFDLRPGEGLLPCQPLSTCEANPFSTATAVWPTDRPIATARAWLNALPPTILRVKGSLQTPEGNWHAERTVDTLEFEPAPACEAPKLVLIAHDDDQADLEQALEDLPPAFS